MKKFIIALMFLVLVSIATGYANMHNDAPEHMGGWYLYSVAGWFLWLIIIVIVGLIIYLFIKTTKFARSSDEYVETPLDLLKKRYVRGEITKEQYDEMKKDILE
jgi:putative membrane protein